MAWSIPQDCDADLTLRRFIADMTDKVIAEKVYEGPKYNLAIFLPETFYGITPGDVRDGLQQFEKERGQ
jgi:hypothetical protein